MAFEYSLSSSCGQSCRLLNNGSWRDRLRTAVVGGPRSPRKPHPASRIVRGSAGSRIDWPVPPVGAERSTHVDRGPPAEGTARSLSVARRETTPRRQQHGQDRLESFLVRFRIQRLVSAAE